MPARLVLFLLVLAVSALHLPRDARAAGVVFRYLPGDPSLSSGVVTANIETGRFLNARDLAARGPGGWGLSAPFAAEFEAPGSALYGTATQALSQPLGPRLTAEVWVRLSVTEGRVPLLTNRVAGAGAFELGVEGGTPYLSISAGGRDFRVDAPAPVAAQTPLWIAATARFDAGTQQLHLTLYVNGHRAATQAFSASIPSPYSIEQPFFVGTEASGTRAAPVPTGRLTGQLFGALVRDYVAADAYLESSVPDDGSAYFGLPAYHDYDLATFHLPMDQRIRQNQSVFRHRFFVPFVNDEFVPQGVATRVNGGEALVYVSYYHLTRSGNTGLRRSIVAELDAATGHVRRAFRLMGTLAYSHAGGIAFVKDALYVSSSSTLERYPVPAYQGPDGPRYLDLAADADGTISVLGRASFVSEHRDTLWVGDWRTPAHEAPYLYGYPLDGDGRAVRNATPRIYALPRNVQGVDFFRHRGETYVFMARNVSQSRGEAEILRVPRARLARWTEPAADSSIVVPYGIEDLSFFPDGTLWTNSESSADYYQKSPSGAWSVFYPFVYSLPAETVFGEPAVITGAADAVRPPAEFGLEATPNPFTDTTVLRVQAARGPARLRVMDALGRHVTTLFDGTTDAEARDLHWEAGNVAPGLYFVVLETAGQRVVRPVTLVR